MLQQLQVLEKLSKAANLYKLWKEREQLLINKKAKKAEIIEARQMQKSLQHTYNELIELFYSSPNNCLDCT